MADTSFLFIPDKVAIEVALEPVLVLLNGLELLNFYQEYPGLDASVAEMAASLTPDQLHTNRLVLHGFSGALYASDEGWESFPAYVDFLENQDAEFFQRMAVEELLSMFQWCKGDSASGKVPEPDTLLESPDTFAAAIKTLYRCKAEDAVPPDDAYLADYYRLMSNPGQAKKVIVEHLRTMWDTILRAFWERALPELVEAVEAGKQVDLSGVSALEAVRILSGRDLSTGKFGQDIQSVQRLLFAPSPFVGPYVSQSRSATSMRLFYRPRLPEGYQGRALVLDRSELLILLSALADDTRLRIVELFKEHDELCAQDIIQMLGLSQSAASRHLRQLAATSFLSERRIEGAKCYRLNRKRLDSFQDAVRNFVPGG